MSALVARLERLCAHELAKGVRPRPSSSGSIFWRWDGFEHEDEGGGERGSMAEERFMGSAPGREPDLQRRRFDTRRQGALTRILGREIFGRAEGDETVYSQK